MKARYIGGESEPGTQTTTIFGLTVKCGAVFEVPEGMEKKARGNPWVEVIEDAAEADAPVKAEAPKRGRKPKADTEGA